MKILAITGLVVGLWSFVCIWLDPPYALQWAAMSIVYSTAVYIVVLGRKA